MCGCMLIFVRKAGRIREDCVCTAEFCSAVIHHLNKAVYRTTNVFCNLKCHIVGRRKHDRIQALFDSKNFIQLSRNVCTTIGDTRDTGSSHGNLITQLSIFKSQKCGHDFCCGAGIKNLIYIFCINSGLCTVFHNHSSSGSDLRSLRPSGYAVGRHRRSLCICSFFRCQYRSREY